MNADILTAARLHELFFYDEQTGCFIRRVRTSNRVKAGDIAGCLNANGYRMIHIDGRRRYVHRLAWLYVTGEHPLGEIDHIDGNRGNNRPSNLRDVTRTINSQNMRCARSDNKHTKLLGATWSKVHCKWRARIKVDGKSISLGLHDTSEAAHAAYIAAKRVMHVGTTI